MKKLLFLFFVFGMFYTKAQTDLYFKVKKLLEQTHPEISTDNRLIAINVWSVNNLESREANKGFDKTCAVYEYARLKGGPRGIVTITINEDNLSSAAVIAYTKDGIHKLVSVKQEDLGDFNMQESNLVFDSNGNQVYKNLPSSEIFNSIHQLITR